LLCVFIMTIWFLRYEAFDYLWWGKEGTEGKIWFYIIYTKESLILYIVLHV